MTPAQTDSRNAKHCTASRTSVDDVGGVDNVHRSPVHPSGTVLVSGVLPYAGPVPEVLGALTNLMGLDLGNNQLTGKPVDVIFSSPLCSI